MCAGEDSGQSLHRQCATGLVYGSPEMFKRNVYREWYGSRTALAAGCWHARWEIKDEEGSDEIRQSLKVTYISCLGDVSEGVGVQRNHHVTRCGVCICLVLMVP